MKKLFVSVMLLTLLLVSCSSTPADCPPCPEPETIVETVEKIMEVPAECPEIECPEIVCPEVVCPELQCQECPTCAEALGPWIVQQNITQLGQYLVPEEMQPGQWAYQADDPDDTCWATTYSDLSGEYDSELDNFYSENKGFFVLKENVRVVKLEFGPCTWSRIGD